MSYELRPKTKTLNPAGELRLKEERNIWVATVRPDGRPHIVPVWFVWADGRLYICIEPESVKARNLAANARICLALEDAARPVICEGEARALPKPWPEPAIQLFREKYHWDVGAESQYTDLVEVTPRKWLSW